MWEIAVHLAVAGGVYDGVFLCYPLSHELSWMGSSTLLSQFLRVFLPTLADNALNFKTMKTSDSMVKST